MNVPIDPALEALAMSELPVSVTSITNFPEKP